MAIKLLSLIEPETIIMGIKYNLVSGICFPSKVHFTAFSYNYKVNYLQLENWIGIINDGMESNGGIIKENNILNFILDKNPYIILYKQYFAI